MLTYRYAEIIHDLTAEFTDEYILGSHSRLRSKPDYRSADQMIQAARSGKQNIVEAVGQSETSSKGLMKLLGVAKASLEELLSDFEDFLRQNKLEKYPKDHPSVAECREVAYRLSNLRNLSDLGDLIERPKLMGNPQDDANFLLTLCHIETYLLSKQIKSAEEKFITEGGFTESLYKKRTDFRNGK